MRLISAKIDVTKIEKARLFQGKTGAKYLDVLLQEVEDDKYGNDFRVVQSVSKEEREKGVRGPILGNGRWLGAKPTHTQPPRSQHVSTTTAANATPEDDDVPF